MSSPSSEHQPRHWLALLWFVIAGLAVLAFHATGRQHEGYRLAYAGVSAIHDTELSFYAWFGLYGLIATVCFALAWRETRVPEWLISAILKSKSNPDIWIVVAAGAVVLTAVVIRHLVLLNEPVADDELTYRFIAQTLLEGRVVNEPSVPPGFVANQFVIATKDVWFGKYPIGHPLVLAIGELARLRGVIVPMLCGASLALTFAIGRKLFSTRVAVLGSLLLAVSPQFVFTAATELSQPTEMFFILLGTWCLLVHDEDSRWRWVLLGAFAWGMSILVRPLPGALCVLVAALAFADIVRRSEASGRRRRLLQLAVATILIGGIAGSILLTNAAQSGDAMTSGYHRAHGSAFFFDFRAEIWSTSFFGALIRQSYWVFGVPLSLMFVPFARPERGRFLFWGLIGAVYCYRLVATKTGVSTTGPVYVAELVPFITLATASGLVALGRALSKLEIPSPRAAVAAIVLGAGTVSVTMFLPVQVESIHRGSFARSRVLLALEAHALDGPAVIFGNHLVELPKMETWAYYPPSPDPGLRDQVIFLRLPPGPRGVASAVAVWQSAMPERRAFVWNLAAPPDQVLLELSAVTPTDTATP